MATHSFFLTLLFLASISYAAMAAYVPPPPGRWQDVPDARTSLEFYQEAQFAVSQSNITGLVFVRILEGQFWASPLLGAVTRRFLIEATNATLYYKVYEGVVTHVLDRDGTNSLRSFEAVFN